MTTTSVSSTDSDTRARLASACRATLDNASRTAATTCSAASSLTTPPELRLGLVETYRSLLRLLPGHEGRLALGFGILTTGRILGMLQPPLWGYLLDAVLATRDHAQLAPRLDHAPSP